MEQIERPTKNEEWKVNGMYCNRLMG